MDNPYKVLGVSPTDSDQTIKSAYKELIKKYHPDKYSNSPLNEMAGEKTAEVNAAFDQIMNMRRGGANAHEVGDDSYNQNYDYSNNFMPDYRQIRDLIQKGDTQTAEKLLSNVDANIRNAEWYFLMGSVNYTKGWLAEAYRNFEKASSMEPSNQEYAAAFSQMKRNQNGYMNGNMNANPYNTTRVGNGCSGCDMCSSLICADCCCEMMGGDLISCC